MGPLSAEAREALELQFERTLQEYDDEEIGYMEYVSHSFCLIKNSIVLECIRFHFGLFIVHTGCLLFYTHFSLCLFLYLFM